MRTTSEAPVAEPQSVDKGVAPPSGRRNDAGHAPVRAAVRIAGLAHSFGDLRVIDRLELDVKPGEVLGIVGPSGCGKSTLLELVSGLRRQSRGEIAVHGSSAPDARLKSCA